MSRKSSAPRIASTEKTSALRHGFRFRWTSPLAAIALTAMLLLAFYHVAGFEFINLDDPQYVINNPFVIGGLHWTNLVQAFRDAHLGTWHPLTWISHMLDVTVFGLDPG